MVPAWNRTQATLVGGERFVKRHQFFSPSPSPSQSATMLGYILLVLWKGWKTQPPAPITKLIRFITLCQPIPTLVLFDAHFALQLSQSFYTLVYDDQLI